MELQLKNIGMIKEANVKLDGLTVIAGENDTGKSTVGKALFIFLKTVKDMSVLKELNTQVALFKHNFIGYYTLLFKEKKLPENSFFQIIDDKALFLSIKRDKNESDEDIISIVAPSIIDIDNAQDILFIETPLVWNFTDFFRDIAQVESQMNIKLDYPFLMKDLNFKLHIKSASDGLDIKDEMTKLMGGEFKKDEMGRYYFDKMGQRIELVNTATGIKYFGIFQVLSQNNYLNENTVLILDEPEVHLHPKWQLKMAEVIVDLVKSGVKIVVNSHSPYMIEALQRYSELEKVNSDFYLAEDGYIDKVKDSNSETLVKIFEKLSEPFDVFEEMDSQRMEQLING